MIGVKIYASERSFSELFKEWRSLGINTVFVSVTLGSEKAFRELARREGIALFLIIPIFFNPEELEKNPGLYAITDRGKRAQEEWVQFVCPTREDYRSQKIEQIKSLIRELNPDGISLDFIRFFVFWEKVYPDRQWASLPHTCFDESCLDNFRKETGRELPPGISGVPAQADWILKNYRQEWMDWKCRVIASMVNSIASEARRIKPEIMINIHAVPWRESDFGGAIKFIAGQDLAASAAYTNFISPMCYSHMLKREPSWIHSVVKDVQSQTQGQVIPSIQVSKAYLSEEFSVEEFSDALQEALKPPSRGVIFWSWEALDQAPEKKGVIRSFIKADSK